MSAPRRLLARLRVIMARGAAPLGDLVDVVAAEMVAEVCSVYAMRPGDLLELAATCGLNPDAIGRTRLRVGEGIVGLCAATGTVMNLPDAQNHPAFAYRPETGEEPYASLVAVPLRRASRTVGVLTVQNRSPRNYDDDEVEALETVAMLLAEVLATSGASDGAEEGVASTLPRVFTGKTLAPGIVIGPVVLHGPRFVARRLLADDPEAELDRLHQAADRMQRRLDELIAAPDAGRRRAARGAGGIPADRRRCRLAAPGRRGDPGRAVGRGRRAARRERAARPDAPHRRPLSARAPVGPRGSGRPAAVGAGRQHGGLAGGPRRDPAGPPAWSGGTARLARARHRRGGDRGGQPGRPRRHHGAGARPADLGRRAGRGRRRRPRGRGGAGRRREPADPASRERREAGLSSAPWRPGSPCRPAGRCCATSRRSPPTARRSG